MDNILVWQNKKILNSGIISKHIKFISKNMRGLLPLYGKERNKLIEYAKKYNISKNEIFGLRNIIRIQKEIVRSKIYHMNVDRIKKKFMELVKEINSNMESNIRPLIRNFLISTKMPISMVFKTISVMPEFKTIPDTGLEYIRKIKETIYTNELESRQQSEIFEHVLENYLQKKNLKFRTETDIKMDKDYNVTPDILFDKPIVVRINGVDHWIRWMDAKNYALVNIPFIIKSLNKQADKYNKIFGSGAFVFHYGIDSTIAISNTMMLDGSFLSPK